MSSDKRIYKELNFLLSVYVGLSVLMLLISTVSFNEIIINFIELFGDSSVYKSVVEVANSYISKYNISKNNNVVYIPVVVIFYALIRDKIDLSKLRRLLSYKYFKISFILIWAFSYWNISQENNRFLSKVPGVFFQEIFIYCEVLFFLWLAIWLGGVFSKGKSVNLKGDTTKREIFNLYRDNLSSKPNRGKYTITWKTHCKKYLNMLNSRRGTLLIGVAGSGKSYSIIEPMIERCIETGQALFNYDVKFPTLTKVAYNAYLRNKVDDSRKFAVIYPNDIRYTSRLNCFDPFITDTEAKSREAVSTVLYNLNKSWIDKQGDFFSDSAIAYMVGIAWYLNIKQRETGKEISTLPHIIEMICNPNSEMGLEVLLAEPECQNVMIAIYTGYAKGANEQLAGQTASLQTALSKIINKNLYYIASKSNIYPDINNYDHPMILNLGGAIETQKAYAPVISLYASTIKQTINDKNRLPMFYMLDEAPTIYIDNLQELPNTGRSNGISTLVGLQSKAQLKLGYGDKAGDVLNKSFGNIIVGQTTEKDLSSDIQELMGSKRVENYSKTRNDKGKISTSYNKEPLKTITFNFLKNLMPGEFVGSLSDMEEDVLKTGSGRSTNFVAKLIIDKKSSQVNKLPYLNEELVKIFKDEIDHSEKNILKEYVEIYNALDILSKDRENEKGNIYLNKFSNLYKTETLRFSEMFLGKYSYRDEIIKEAYIEAEKLGIKKDANFYKSLEKKISIESCEKKNSAIKYFEKICKKSRVVKFERGEINIKDIKLKDYLFHFISKNYHRKEEERIINNVLDDNFKRIKEESKNFILEQFILLQLKKHFQSCLSEERFYCYDEFHRHFNFFPKKNVELDNLHKEWMESWLRDFDKNLFTLDVMDMLKNFIINKPYFDIRKTKGSEVRENFDINKFMVEMPSRLKTSFISYYSNIYRKMELRSEGKINYTEVNDKITSEIRKLPLELLTCLDNYFMKLVK